LTSVAVEAVIMVPLLVAEILLFPFLASSMSSYWANATRDVALQEAASQMGSTIQQLYLSLNQQEISAGTITQASTFPTLIASHAYTAKGSLKTSLQPGSSKILLLNLTLQGVGNSAAVQVSLGPNVSWNGASVFNSLSSSASIRVQKFANATMLFSFG
jgi:hypothetical protein